MRFRTIQKTPDTGRLDRDEVRAAVIRVRDRRWAAAARAERNALRAKMAAEPRAPYGTPHHHDEER